MTRILPLHLAIAMFAATAQALGQSPPAPPYQGPPGPPPPTFYEPITGSERFNWFAKSSLGPESLTAGVLSAGWGTAFNRPEEYGTQWEGFGKRYGMRLTGVVTGNAIEAGLGTVCGEDPRYVPSRKRGFLDRIGHAGKFTFLAYGRDGSLRPAFARYVGNVGGNFLSNAWRVESESTAGAATARVGLGFAGRFVGNLVSEFRPRKRGK